MNSYYSIKRENWEADLIKLSDLFGIYAATENGHLPEYEPVNTGNIGNMVYNRPKPSTPLKTFFLPVKENVTEEIRPGKQRIIIGVPNCDVTALRLLDEIYMDSSFEDMYYRHKRENTYIIASDCFDVLEHCHCVSYNVMPYADSTADLSIILKGDDVIIRIISGRGEQLIKDHFRAVPVTGKDITSFIATRQREVVEILSRMNKGLPDYITTGDLVNSADEKVWHHHSLRCVSCGACTAICPTCTCFLLIDKPGFHKLKQMDACQYPGFERVAGGEDSLAELPKRFRNRYMCKYVWKPARFSGIACTGCGRCIEACIGKINKNEIFRELAK